MNKPTSDFINRELSWLEFNQRVLDEALDTSIPLLERMMFLAITALNMDEFFMVRVGGLQLLQEQKVVSKDPSGMTATEQLEAIKTRTHQMVEEQYRCFLDDLEPALSEAGLKRVRAEEMTDYQVKYVQNYFEDEIYSVLTPMSIMKKEDFPLLANQSLNICVQLSPDDKKPESEEEPQPRFAIIPLANSVSRIITLPTEGGYQYILLEDLISFMINHFFPGQKIIESVPFRITRNADIKLQEDQASDLLAEMQILLDARKISSCVRLEISDSVTTKTKAFLKNILEIKENRIYPMPGPLHLGDFMSLKNLSGFEKLKYESWPPQQSPQIDPSKSMFDLISEGDLFLFHPYQSYEPVVRMIEEAANDPDVLAIKQTLYRTSSDSPIVQALIQAAENGIAVTVIVELKARFDEARNINWAKNMEQSGVQVIYGVKRFKTHAKICAIIRREPQGIQRYVHFGTGNYNEKTAGLYSDASLFTCKEEFGLDASTFFNTITGYSDPQKFKKIDMAPISLRKNILDLIQGEIERKRQGQKAFIKAKLNSLVDPKIIKAFYKASQLGVKIKLNIRGICCLKPGIKGLSDNITVTSIIDRYLEHSRIIYFHHGGEELVYISSADWMPRNLDRRVELLVPVEDQEIKQLMIKILDTYFEDTLKVQILQPDGTYERAKLAKNEKPVQSQLKLYREFSQMAKIAKKSRRGVFETYQANPDT